MDRIGTAMAWGLRSQVRYHKTGAFSLKQVPKNTNRMILEQDPVHTDVKLPIVWFLNGRGH